MSTSSGGDRGDSLSGQQGPARDSAQTSRDRLQALSILELEVLSLLVKGKSDFAIALALSISPGEVQTHVADILRIMGLERRAQIPTFWAEALRESDDISAPER